ncbi:uncharacterized protein LOC114349755 [Ostrinia furnacalis]|uniref:uncharacterized protein LOC114349755 n=1 Tax=Ostrinia furnacalis TaxID=93504 RepID=UPI00103E6393|nr:uncharacterized protein LOC114349755 [Ostrinia furnacalis]
MATDVVAEDFVTIVPVGEGRPVPKENTFVTVLTVGAAAGAAEVVVRRSRGERLGLGLKFEGGSAAAEKVRRLLVQSCAEDSPAANAVTPWGKLIPGDEILAIDGVSVSELTRIDCVRRLKDSDESLTLLVRHFESPGNTEVNNSDISEMATNTKVVTELVRPTTLPPPVPPRKLGKKNSFKDKQTLQTVGEQNTVNNDVHILGEKEPTTNGQHNGMTTMTKLSRKSSFDSHIHRQSKEGIACLKKGSPEEVRRLVRRLSDGKAMPPEAEVYIDLLSTEWERCLLLADAESDDTGSSISTVVDRLGSMASSVENSIPSTPIMQPKTIDLQKVLNCVENIDSNILKDITSSKFLEKQINKELTVLEKITTANGFNNHENSNQVSQISEEPIPSPKKLLQNDKNNNNTLVQNTSPVEVTHQSQTKKEIKIEPVIDKPKPMPRNAKVERSVSEKKLRPIPVPETPPPPVPEPLLTPTKKNCIETWLQRSEAEMNNKNIEKVEENALPEALPRLIDFVPKPQFKEREPNDVPLTRPTTAPPPPPPAPPVETREDGSGASLDTIGELDESIDVTDNVKPIAIENETKDRKTFERSFWEDRINKSDAEDKSLSNDETPLPSCPRQPPDGVETPSDAVEKIPEPPTRLPPRLTAGWPTATGTRSRYSYSSRSQDARSEASVKDKIAMFSNGRATSSERLDKCGTLPTRVLSTVRKSTVAYTSSYPEVSSLDRRLTKSQDNLDETPRSYKKQISVDRPEVLGAIESTGASTFNMTRNNKSHQVESKPFFYGSTTTLPSSIDTSFKQPIYHARSISDDNTNAKTSVHKSNLEYLIEQRKKCMSKLKDLVIPEVQTPIIDLPEIKVQDTFTKSFLAKPNQTNISNQDSKANNNTPATANEIKWKANLLPNNLPKYSPAFKRKSLQVYTPSSLSKESTPERKFNDKVDLINKMNTHSYVAKPFRTSFDVNSEHVRLGSSTLPSKTTLQNVGNMPKKEYKDIMNYVRDYKNVEIKICTATDVVDSDNDSAMSSTQSSYRSSASSPMHNLDTIESDSSRLSPRISHYTPYSLIKTDAPTKSSVVEKSCEEYMKRKVCRSVSSDTNVSLSSSAGSAATSGSQASCSSLESSVADSDKRKVSKTYNIDTINRRNILASAKCRSGRDAKLKSPVIETKFSHESYDRSPSPTDKVSDRLSTLTSSVSAVSNKGENRRRNKIIAESDSDSDCDISVRQRKTDFKNTRLKRNSSSANKAKPNEINSEAPKIEDGPKVISEKIIKEIKKAGLDNFNSKVTKSADKINNEPIIKQSMTKTKQETIKKTAIIDTPIQNKQNDVEKPVILPQDTKVHVNKKSDVIAVDKIDGPAEDIKIQTHTIRLKRGAGTGVGLILAGGIDCEAKDVTVHRVLADSIAAKAGLKRGAKVRSINGFAMTGITHAQSVTILKEQRTEVVIEIENETQEIARGTGCGSENAESKVRQEEEAEDSAGVVSVVLEKAGGGAGLGFGLDGGRDSPHGDRPLTIKKLFAGGAAAQCGRVLVGAELLSAGGQSMEGFTRTQAWAALKSLPVGPVTLVLRNPKTT